MPAIRLTVAVAGLTSLNPSARSEGAVAASIARPITIRPAPEAADQPRTSAESTAAVKAPRLNLPNRLRQA
jgi:hypothetical protein